MVAVRVDVILREARPKDPQLVTGNEKRILRYAQDDIHTGPRSGKPPHPNPLPEAREKSLNFRDIGAG